MKKKFILLGSIITVLLVAGIILAVVLLKPDDNSNNNGDQPNLGNPTVQLEVPRGITLDGKVLSWDKVENATGYIVYVGDKTFETAECSIDLNGKANERDVLTVVAKAEGFINSEKSITKIYITVIDKQEVATMGTKVTDYMSKLGFTSEAIKEVSGAVENVCTSLYKEGLLASDVENIVNTVDSVAENLGNLNSVENVSDYVEAVTTELGKLVEINVSSFAITSAIKEVFSFVIDTVLENVEGPKQNLCLVVKINPLYGLTEEDAIKLLVNLKEYLDNISNRDLEKVAIVFDSFREVYSALKVELPAIISEIEKLEKIDENEVNFESVYSAVESIVKVKDSILTAVISGMPTMNEFTEVLSLFESLYDNLAPEYIVENNPYDLVISIYQKMYSNVHQLLNFYKEMDADLLVELKPYISNICTILEGEVMDYLNYTSNFEFSLKIPYLDSIMYFLTQTGLSEEEVEDLIIGLAALGQDLAVNPEIFFEEISKEFVKVFEDFDYSVITEDPLVQKIMTIVLAEDKELELEKFLKEDLKIEKYISYKDGKTFNDLTNALLNVSIEDLITFLTNNPEFTINNILSVLGIEEIVNVNIQGLFSSVVSLIDVDTLSLIKDVLKIQNIESIEKILAKYFNVDVNFKELFDSTISNILDEYNLDLEYKGLIKAFIENLSLNKLYAEVENIYKVLEKHVTDFNANFVPLVPTKESLSIEEVLNYSSKYALYSLFGDNADNAVEDLKEIYSLIVDLKEHDEIVNIYNNVLDLFKNYDYSFNFDSFINDDEYVEILNNRFEELLKNIFDEVVDTYDWVLDFEDDFAEIAKELDKFTTEYFGGSFKIDEYVDMLFELLNSYDISKDLNDIYEMLTGEIYVGSYNIREVLKDLVEVYELLLPLKEHDEIVDIFNEFIQIIYNYDYSFDLNAYLNDEEYVKTFNEKLINALYNLLYKADDAFQWVLTLEEDIEAIAKKLDQLVEKYYGLPLGLYVNVNYLFEMIEMYALTENTIVIPERVIKEIVEVWLKEIINDSYDLSINISELYDELYIVFEENVLNVIELFNNFDEMISIEQYITDEEYRLNLNQKVIDLCYDLIDEYVLIYENALTTEDLFAELGLYIDELCVKYFGDYIGLDYTVEELFELLNEYVLEDYQIDTAKEYVELFVNEYLPTIIIELYNVSDEVYALLEEAYNDINANMSEMVNLAYDIYNTYRECYLEAEAECEYIVIVPGYEGQYYLVYDNYKIKAEAIKKLFDKKEAEINALCDILEEIIHTDNEEYLDNINDAIANIEDVLPFKLGYNATDVYNELLMLVEILKVLDEFYIDVEYPEGEVILPSY